MSGIINANGTNTQLGIDENGLRELITKLGEEIETIKLAFNKIESVADESVEYFIGEAGNAFREKVKNVLVYYPTLESNLTSYKTDLECFLDSYINFEGHFTISEDVDSKTMQTTTGVSSFNG